ncbi:MAG: HAMP domain-containing histidine kinase [Gammaproteobacteria bacterium]|nr:HAMP domain-containing histidine kinase [Gammaproteobacteria bacterium]MCP5201392.1 HAMP domain-containing histidine kinase [Gammaproteobacteria bacterium]
MVEFGDLAHTSAEARAGLSAAAEIELRNRVREEVSRRAVPGMFAIVFGTVACGVLSGHAADAPGAFAGVVAAMAAAILARVPFIRSLRRDGAQCDWRDEGGFFCAALLLPLAWAGYSALLLLSYPNHWLSAGILAFTAAMSSSVVITFGMWRNLALAYIVLLMVPTAAVGMLLGSNLGLGVTAGCLVFSYYLVSQVTNWNRFFWSSQLANAHLERRTLELAAAKEAAEAASRAKSDFLTCMSHELRTPMNAVLGFAQLIELTADQPEEVRSNGREIRAAGRHLMALIEELLDLSRIESGQLTLDLQPLDLHGIAGRVIETLHGAVPPAVALELEVSDPLPQCHGDPLRVRQVLVNLVGNALKFTPRGRVTVSLSAPGDSVQMRVRDTGIGIEPALLEHIFAPFVQGDSSPTRHFDGTGLGLAISRELVEAMGGRIEVSSAPGAGSEFVVHLPLQPPALASSG